MSARIYQPVKNVMQSGKAKKDWILEYTPTQKDQFVEPLMGWTASRDTKRQLRLKFPTKDAAIEYAKRQNINAVVSDPKERKLILQSYADNFQ